MNTMDLEDKKIEEGQKNNNIEENITKTDANTNNKARVQNFTLGSSKDDVTNVMGTPSSIRSSSIGDTWNYDLSSIKFGTTGKVEGWDNYSNNLKVVLGTKDPNALGITLGSSKDDVTNAMGTPSSIRSSSIGDTWNYDLSSIKFGTTGKVEGWDNYSNNLKVVLGTKDPNALGIMLGSSKEDVAKAMGTPSSIRRSIIGDTWNYDLSSVKFDTNDKVEGWDNYSNNLKLK